MIYTYTHRLIPYSEYVNEAIVIELLLEGALVASDKFLTRLSSIHNNQIASKLYDTFINKVNIDKSMPQNYIDVSDKDDTISFISDRAIDRLISSDSNTDPYNTKGRGEVKVGRFARAILSELGDKNVTDKDIETFVNSYKAAKVDDSKKFILVNGPIIRKYYHHNNYAIEKGSLGSSCMKHEDCQSYFKIYTRNPDQCQLLVFIDENEKVLGRALVWKISNSELYNPTNLDTPIDCKAKYFMDRVYTVNDSDIIKFINYAKQQGWLYKYKMSAGDPESMMFKYNDTTLIGRIEVKLTRVHFGSYPFVDTLTYCDNENTISNVGFTNDSSDDPEESFLMDETDGTSSKCRMCSGTGYDPDTSTNCKRCGGDKSVECPSCRGTTHQVCDSCNARGYIKCPKCDGAGDVTCPVCNGDGTIDCSVCGGRKDIECPKCHGDWNKGQCPTCGGETEVVCTKCGGKEFVCPTCKGNGEYVRKWGNGTRTVACTDCLQTGRGRCEECSFLTWTGKDFVNSGMITCPTCIGVGNLKCEECTQGRIDCEECGGDGDIMCSNDCEYGYIKCDLCNGSGKKEDCAKCNGTGRLGDCGNAQCQDGEIECPICKGTGKRSASKQLCPECSGLFNKFKQDITDGPKPGNTIVQL